MRFRHLLTSAVGMAVLTLTGCGANAQDGSANIAQSATDVAASDTNGADSDEPIEVRWFVGLGTGSQDEAIERQLAVVEAFNASQSEIELTVDFVTNSIATDVLATQIAAGNPPDIIGPVGREGANAFAGQYLDLEPLIENTDFDLSAFGGSQESYRTADGALEGIPFASFPSALFYNTALFDEAGLPHPPTSYDSDGLSVYGEGTEWEGLWDYDKLAEVAAVLSVDGDGDDATSAQFDRSRVEQFGFAHQWTTNPSSLGTSFGAGSLVANDGTARIPQDWVDSYRWYHSLIHEVGAAPNQAETGSTLLAGNAFNSGNVAMVSTHLWYTCCIADVGDAWNLAALPSHNGQLVSKLHDDTFRIHTHSENPQAAFTVLEYFFDDAAIDLLDIYGGMPARPDLRDPYFANLNEQFPQDVNWDVAIAGLDFADVPSHQATFPNFLESNARLQEFEVPLLEDPELDVEAAIAALETDLTELFTR